MTARLIFNAVLIEMNKVLAPSLLLEDYNYLINRAIYLYINKRYNIYDISLQTGDDLHVLKSTALLTPEKTKLYGELTSGEVTLINSLYGATYDVMLPTDYFHILNCVCFYEVTKQYSCYNKGTYKEFGATRLTADSWSQILNNYYMRPSYKRPYYYIHNVNTNPTNPTNPYSAKDNTVSYLNEKGEEQTAYKKVVTIEESGEEKVTYEPIKYKEEYGTDIKSASSDLEYHTTNVVSERPRTIQIGGEDVDNVEREGEIRYGNIAPVRMEIRYGHDDSVFKLVAVHVDYLKTPQHIRLTLEQLDLTEDTSQMMEFPDYVCQEIINELVHILMENSGDPRLQTHIPVSQSIANPAQALEPAQLQNLRA